MKQTIFLMLGYPGAGKTTTAKIIADLTGSKYLSSDEIRAELFPDSKFTQSEHDHLYDFINKRTQSLLTQGKSVVYDANLNRYAHRKEKYYLCESDKVRSVLIWVKTEKAIAKARAAHESRQHLWPANETPEDMFDRIAGILEPPKSDEPHITIDGTKVNRDYIEDQLVTAKIL